VRSTSTRPSACEDPEDDRGGDVEEDLSYPDATRADVSYFTAPSLPRATGNRGTGRYQAVPALLTGLGCGCSHSS
jgi:hypothetical protein